MISEEQELEIEKYLMSKNLPLDILFEVKDHFMTQIDCFQIEKKVSFDTAFRDTKEIWKEDLKQVKYYNEKEIASFAKDIKDKNAKKKLRRSVLSTIVAITVLFSLSRLMGKSDFSEFFMYAIIIFVSVPGIFVLRYMKFYHLSFQNKKTRLNIYQGYEGLSMYFGFLFPFITGYYSQAGDGIYQFFSGSIDEFTDILFFTIISLSYFFTIFMQVGFIKSAKKMTNEINRLHRLKI